MQIPFEGNPIGYAILSGAPPTPPDPMPTSGLTYWMPFASSYITPNIGNNLTVDGDTPTLTTIKGIPCVKCEGNTRLYEYDTAAYWNLPQGSNTNVTVSFWVYVEEFPSKDYSAFTIGQHVGSVDGRGIPISINTNYKIFFNYMGSTGFGYSSYEEGKWYHILFTQNSDNTFNGYVNGEFVGTQYRTLKQCNHHTISFGCEFGSSEGSIDYNSPLKGAYAGVRIYNRVLDIDEITTLASEFTQEGVITAEDLMTTFYPAYESVGITYTSTNTPTFEIISGSLPNEISFDTSTGVFSGSAPTDEDHEYDLVVRITADASVPVDVNVTIYTVATARIDFYGDTFNFTTEALESQYVNVYYSDEPVTLEYYSGTLPSGVTFDGTYFNSDGTQTASETQYVTLKATSEHNQDGVTAEFTLTVNVNQLGLSDKTLKFYTDDGQVTKALVYTTANPITPVWSIISGTLPSGVTFDTISGAFTSDGSQTADVSGTVGVQVASSTGCSTPASAVITLEVINGAHAIPDDYVFYAPLSSANALSAETGQAFIYRTNTLSAETIEGLTAVHFTGDSNEGIYTTDMSNLPSGNNDFTMCCWIRSASVSTNRDIFSYGRYTGDKVAFLGTFNNDKFKFGYWGFDIDDGNNDGYWHFILQKNESGVLKTYVDGVLMSEYSYTANISLVNGKICIGAYWQGSHWDPVFDGYITAARIYDRALNDGEIAALAAEFTPTT